jgi:hypothetical protein
MRTEFAQIPEEEQVMPKWLVPLAALLLAMPGMHVAALDVIRVVGGDLRSRQ